MAKSSTPVMTRFTTGKARLTYAFLWQPRASDNDDSDGDKEKYSTCVLIPKEDQQTIAWFKKAFDAACQAGQSKGLWGATLPGNFKIPLRDGDAEYLEKGEEYKGHWFLNVSSTRKPQIVDLAMNPIYDESEVYSGCYARVCINLFPFNQKGNRGVGCGLEAVQKICDGEALGGVPVDVNEAFAGSEAYMADAGYAQPAAGYPQQTPVQQQAYPQTAGQQQGYIPQQQAAPMGQGYPQQTPAVYPVQQSVGFQTPMQGAPNTFASNVAVADSILPPQLFGSGQQANVA